MRPLELFLKEIDAGWKPLHSGKQALHIIGCGALILQTDYQRGTKDSDILEAADLDTVTKNSLLALAGKNSTLHARHRHSDDRADIQAMIARGLIPHSALIARFEAAKDIRQETSYADDLPKYVANLNRVERDYLGVEESVIDLPSWV